MYFLLGICPRSALKNKILKFFPILAGGTSVSYGLMCPADETRTIISLDTSQMVYDNFRHV